MKDAVGGIVNIWIIAIFIVLISGYLAFSVQYNKAFRMKNEIIEAIEQCDGYESGTSKACVEEIISNYMDKIGYNVPNWTWDECPSTTTDGCSEGTGFWVKKHRVSSSSEVGEQYYYTVATAINTDIPIFRYYIPNMNIFQVTGNTKRITLH